MVLVGCWRLELGGGSSTNSEGQWSWGQNLVDLLFSLPLTPGCDVPENDSSEYMILVIILRIVLLKESYRFFKVMEG